jgi:lysophospholipase L1-like esterase
MRMRVLDVDGSWFQGVVSVERVGEGLRPWRLPHQRRHLFDDGLLARAACTSGVRLRFETDATALSLAFEPLEAPTPVIPNGHCFDVVVDNCIVAVTRCAGGATEARFDAIGTGRRIVEVWLPPSCPVTVTALTAEGATFARAVPDPRPRWVTWGSSLTHCVRAGSAARTWPASVARRHDLNLLSLGFGGQCHLDPTVAMVIRDLPAQAISMKLGINTVGGSVNERTYPALVTAAVAIVREKHPDTPLVLISPIGYPPHETTPNAVGYTIEGMRRDMEGVYRRLVETGDRHLYYVNGLNLFSVREIAAYTEDQCHPNAEGMDLQAEHFTEHVMPLFADVLANCASGPGWPDRSAHATRCHEGLGTEPGSGCD